MSCRNSALATLAGLAAAALLAVAPGAAAETGATAADRADRADRAAGATGGARAGAAAAAAAENRGAGEPAVLDVRRLPTVVKVWSQRVEANRLAVRRPAVYARSGPVVSALVLRSGRKLWSRQLGDLSCCGDEIVLAGSTVVADADGKLLLIDAADGSVRAEVELGPIGAYVGPPVVVLAGRDELVAVDPAAGQVTARRPLSDEVVHLAVEDGYAMVGLAAEDRLTTAGYTADGLREVWRHEGARGESASWLEDLGGKLHLARGSRQESSEYLPIEPATGSLGRPLRAEPGVTMVPMWPAGLQLVRAGADAASSAGQTEALRRVDTGGRPLWTIELPCHVLGAAREGGVLAASCVRGDAGRGRGLLAILSWESGEMRQLAYGMPGLTDLVLAGDLALAATGGEVVAFSTTEFGPPEAEASLEELVRRILLDTRGDDGSAGRGDFIMDRVDELEPLGAAAYPFILRLLPRLGPTSLAAAADALAAGGHRPAAPALARALQSGRLGKPAPGSAFKGWDPRFALLRALAVLGGDAEVPAVAAWLEGRGQAAGMGSARREALATLVAMRSPAADAAVRAFLAAPPPRQPVWNPPRPPGLPAPPAAPARPGPAAPDASASGASAADAHGGGGADGADGAAGAAGADSGDASGAAAPDAESGGVIPVRLREGRRLVLFRDGYLGSPDDLWVAELDGDGRAAGPARFTGARLPLDDELRPADLVGRASGDRVAVRDGAGRELAAFSLARAAEDSDGDGLTDLVERRLRLDPNNPDTDGDGLRDSEDPAPNARLREPRDDEQAIAAAIFRQFFQFEDGVDEPAAMAAVMVSDFALEWQGRRDPTITLDAREAARLREETGDGSVPLITIRRGAPRAAAPPLMSGDPPGPTPALGPDEEAYTLALDRGRFHSRTYRVVVRNLNAAQPTAPRLWAVSWLRLAWAN
jgi:hypothetical protein